MENLERLIWDKKTGFPKWFKPLDLAVLMVLGCNLYDGALCVSHETLAECCAASPSTVKRSIKALSAAGLLSKKSGARMKRANWYEVRWERIPWTDHKKVIVTESAKHLADYYAQVWKFSRPTRISKLGTTYPVQPPRDYRTRWSYLLQRDGLDRSISDGAIAQQIQKMADTDLRTFAKGPQAWLDKWNGGDARKEPITI